jgi:DNA phosphorothioation-dependent restriction protein DptG
MADGSQQLLVILTAVCCENKKQVQFNYKGN